MLDEIAPLLERSPWPLTTGDVALALNVDEAIVWITLRVLRAAGRARVGADGRWTCGRPQAR